LFKEEFLKLYLLTILTDADTSRLVGYVAPIVAETVFLISCSLALLTVESERYERL